MKVKGLPNIKLSTNRVLPDSTDLKGVTITYRGRNLTVNLTYAVEVQLLPPSSEQVGLDMGITDRVVLSTSEYIPRRRSNPVSKRKQQRLSSCKRGSGTRNKRRLILNNANRKERVTDRNRTHRYTTAIIKRFQLIAVENLNIPNMTKKGSHKRGLNREIATQGLGRFLTQLTYKAESAGREVIQVNPAYTSQECSICGNRGIRDGKLFSCLNCELELELEADWNGSVNILKRAGGTALQEVPVGGLKPLSVV